MSWIKQTKLTWLQSVAVRVLKAGKVPSHLAVIMDGNRRFARKQNMRSVEGHVQGFDKLAEVLYWCSELGVTEVTVYAFSIENFKRSKDEVEGLLDLALQKLRNMLNEMDKIHEHGVCIRVLGNLSYLPVELQKVVAEVVHQTQANSRCFLNICLSYTSRDEICKAMQELATGVEKGVLSSNDVSEAALSHAMYSRKSRDPELLVRTSGEVRLSDFMLWQSSRSVIEFTTVLWPEFTIWHLLAAILYYQRHCGLVEAFKSARPREWQSADDQSLQRFIDDVEARWQERLQLMRLGQTAQEVVVT
uniref:Alkyl transferase n=1 Tax=Rhipicephalus appendiculatus TaxID=34631 RepID=A0A131Z3L3_RHIAP